ncbi:tyrosine kinase receptor Cad96Ca-like [Ptychodera flava]|uniref:tyrosine kinase receptor Cad96Ca-like n=1 Tax=Ptychodera flava TaxID=63121 RepID=UPI00396A4C7F
MYGQMMDSGTTSEEKRSRQFDKQMGKGKVSSENIKLDVIHSLDLNTIEPFLETKGNLSFEHFEIDYNRLKFYDDGKLGKGEFGIVHKATIQNTDDNSKYTEVAVKCLKEKPSKENEEDFLREIKITISLQSHHPNIVKVVGCCTYGDPKCLVLELAPFGNVQDYLLLNRSSEIYENVHPNSKDLTIFNLINFAWQIAKGMSFVASKKYIHGDLAARNVLLGANMCCKINDFGFAQDVSTVSEYQHPVQVPLRDVIYAIYMILSHITLL